ncbi:MAG: CAAD domain-containing protein [Synechococcales cyanobacterium T60_A2020_003]|nr:CAAD domain-containing protein [Synechococcales cyanobacterium T60_A2020_003]
MNDVISDSAEAAAEALRSSAESLEEASSKIESTQFPSGEQAKEQWQEIVDKVSAFLAELPEYLSGFFGEYKQPIVTVGLIVAAIISVKLTLAVLGALNDIPLLSPLLELIGLGYSAWFVYRYLWKASSRQELANDFNALKEQVLGNNPFK